MEFFKLLGENLQDGQQIIMTIRKNGDKLVTSIMADNKGVKDSAVKDISPLCLNGTPEEYEEGFKEAFKPISKTLGLMSELKTYEASVEEARKKTEMVKNEKKKSEDEKKAFNDAIAQAIKLKDEHKFKDAKAVLEKAMKLPNADKAKIASTLTAISQASGEGSLFGGVEDLSDGEALSNDNDEETED